MRPETVLREGVFDPRLKTYHYWNGVFLLLVSVFGIPLLPIWLLGWGSHITRRQFEALGCILTDRSLKISSGYLFRVEKSIPLDKITDLALHEGPILRWLGLMMLKGETAGQSGPGSLASMIGLVKALDFRDAVLEQRDLVTFKEGQAESAASQAEEPPRTSADNEVLHEIRDCLNRIESQLRDRRA